jgi:hypothetical protein
MVMMNSRRPFAARSPRRVPTGAAEVARLAGGSPGGVVLLYLVRSNRGDPLAELPIDVGRVDQRACDLAGIFLADPA